MTIAVIGAGASGMMAALTAAEQPENKSLLSSGLFAFLSPVLLEFNHIPYRAQRILQLAHRH